MQSTSSLVAVTALALLALVVLVLAMNGAFTGDDGGLHIIIGR